MCTTRKIKADDFNPRSREGSDMLIFPWTFYDHDFNPRSREGSDVAKRAEVVSQEISIHAPARGATKNPKKKYI